MYCFRSSVFWKLTVAQASRLRALVSKLKAQNPLANSSLRAFQMDLKASAAELKTVCGALERDFLATGVALEKLAGHGEKFLHASEDLVGSATGRSSGSVLLLNAVQVVQQPLNFLGDSHPQTQLILQRLRQDASRIDELINVQVELQQTIGPLKYIQTLFKIESAPLGTEVQAMFGALTKEIETLHDQICDLFTTRFLELRAVQRTVNQVITELQTQSDSLWESIAKEKTQIETSLQRMQVELAENQSRQSQIGQLGRKINNEIQEVVMGLQYQDIISQKLHHAMASLSRLDERLGAAQPGAELGASCRLEAGQIQAVREELDQAESRIKGGIGRTLEHLSSANSGCLTLEEFNQLTTSADGMVQMLFDTFATLRQQVAATASSSARAYDQLRSVGGLASDLTVVVRDLSQRIHLIGLNAQLQAAQVGRHAGLEVLSARTSEISQATNRISENVAGKLDRLVKDLADDVKALEMLNTEALRQQNHLAAAGTSTEHGLHEMRDRALGLLADIDSLFSDIRKESEDLLAGVRHVETADSALVGLEGKLRKFAEVFGAQVALAPGQSDALLEQAQRDYTMTSQRKVFAKVFDSQSPPVATSEEGSVELFDLPAPAVPAAAALPVQMPPAEAPLPSSAAAEPTSIPAPPAAPPADLGKNVELF
jgi:gas vesicle protein